MKSLVEYDGSSSDGEIKGGLVEQKVKVEYEPVKVSNGLFDMDNLGSFEGTPEKSSPEEPICCICQSAKKYKCPECDRLTCSVACVKQHKSLFGCTGSTLKRHLAFVPKESFNETTFRRDIHFIEQLNRNLNNTFSDDQKQSRVSHNQYTRQKHGFAVKQHLKKNNTELVLLPPHFTARKQNKCRMNTKTGQVHMTVKVKDKFCHQCTLDMKWSDVLNKINVKKPDDADLKIQDLTSAKKREGRVFTDVPLEETLKQTLMGKTIVEFPVLTF